MRLIFIFTKTQFDYAIYPENVEKEIFMFEKS